MKEVRDKKVRDTNKKELKDDNFGKELNFSKDNNKVKSEVGTRTSTNSIENFPFVLPSAVDPETTINRLTGSTPGLT